MSERAPMPEAVSGVLVMPLVPPQSVRCPRCGYLTAPQEEEGLIIEAPIHPLPTGGMCFPEDEP